MARFSSMLGVPYTQNVWLRRGIVSTAALLLAACTTQSYMGISLVPGQASAEVQELAQRAQAGDKQAQLDLGIRYEEGNGVPRRVDYARRLYKAAAQTSGGTQLLYLPAGPDTSASATPVYLGPIRPGIAEAKQRLSNLLNRNN
jgi:TPR repeat protein